VGERASHRQGTEVEWDGTRRKIRAGGRRILIPGEDGACMRQRCPFEVGGISRSYLRKGHQLGCGYSRGVIIRWRMEDGRWTDYDQTRYEIRHPTYTSLGCSRKVRS
jgi:hypothetical protein